MILKECFIDNFGKFSDTKIVFQNDITSFIQENGWGKTTLASFIKAMFYGMNETRKQKAFLDREKYFPWQGGKFGGNLVFSKDGCDYKIIRYFSTKKKDDVFELYDINSNKLTSDYSENIGEEIFGVNLDTFERSVFVTLDDDKKPQGSVDITAKLNNLVEAGDDVANFNSAYKALDEKSKQLKAARGNGGKINELLGQIQHDNEMILKIESYEKSVENWQNLISEKKDYLSRQNETMKLLQKEFSISEKYLKSRTYLSLKDKKTAFENQQSAILDFFQGSIPENQTLESISAKNIECSKYKTLSIENNVTEIDRNTLNEINASFKGDVPSLEDISLCQKDYDKYNSICQEKIRYELSDSEKKEYDELKSKFYDKDITQEKINKCLSDYENIQDVKSQTLKINAEKNTLENELERLKQIKPRNTKRIVFIALSIFSICADILLFVLMKQFFSSTVVFISLLAVLCASGIVFLLLGIFQKPVKPVFSGQEDKIQDYQIQITRNQADIDEFEKECDAFISQVSANNGNMAVTVILSNIKNDFSKYEMLDGKFRNYTEWFSSLPVKPEEYGQKIIAFEIKYNQKEDVSLVSSILELLRDKTAKLNGLQKRIKEFDKNKELFEKSELELDKYLQMFKTDKTQNYDRQIQSCYEKKHDYVQLTQNIRQLDDEIAKFESCNDIIELENIAPPQKTVDELQYEMNEVQNGINLAGQENARLQTSIDSYSVEIDSRSEIENDLERSKSGLENAKSYFKILQDTMQYLTEAKEQLEKKYMDPMRKSFKKYSGLLDNRLNFDIDTDLNVSIENKGTPYRSDFLSNGYKDLVNFCSRMALVDSLYKTEKPALILDDPFVNLDDDKTEKAIFLIKEIAKENQVIYFTCCKTRGAI